MRIYFYRKYLIDELLPIFKMLGFETRTTDSFTDILLRKTVIKTICRLGYESCSERSDFYFRNLMRDEGENSLHSISPLKETVLINFNSASGAGSNFTIPNNIVDTVYCVSIANGGQKEWDFLWQMYLKSNNANEKTNILRALSCSKEVWILQVGKKKLEKAFIIQKL